MASNFLHLHTKDNLFRIDSGQGISRHHMAPQKHSSLTGYCTNCKETPWSKKIKSAICFIDLDY